MAAKKVNPVWLLNKINNRLKEVAEKSYEVKAIQEKTEEVLTLIRKDLAKILGQASDEVLDDPAYKDSVDKVIKNYADEIESLGKELNKKSEFLGNLVEPLGKKLTDLREVWRIEQDAAKVGSGIRNILNADTIENARAELKVFKESLKDLDTVKLLGKRGGIATTAAKVGKLTVYTIGVECLAEWINRKAASRQTLVLRPLLINGKEFSAGINGHLGCVAGDPDGFWDGVIQSMTNWDYRNKKHNRGDLYNFNGDKDSRIRFGDIAYGLVNIVGWAAGVDQVNYSSLSEQEMDTHVLGGTSIPEEEIDAYVDARIEAINKLNASMGISTVIGSDDYIIGYDEGSGFSKVLTKEPYPGDYGPNHCNWYAWDVAKANGWNAPTRTPGKNTGTGTNGIRINDLPKYPKYYTKLLTGDAANNIENIEPGMLVRLDPQHYAIVTGDKKLNENLNGKIQTTRKLESVTSKIVWAIMPKYE